MHATDLRALPPERRAKAIAALSDDQAAELLADWTFWARPEQLAPPGDWTGWLVLAGRGFGKTRTGAEWVSDCVLRHGYRRIGLIAETSADGRDVLVEGPVGLLSVGPLDAKPVYEPSKRRVTWPNGAVATLYDAREPDQLRGPQHDLIWFDELAKFRYAQEVFDQAMFGLRLGDHPRWLATTTPRPIPLIRAMLRDPSVTVTRGKTRDNLANLAPAFQAQIIAKYEGTRLGRQELDAEILDDAPGALWSRRNLDDYRVNEAPELKRIVIGVDPAVTSHEGSDEQGIVVAGLAGNGHAYVLDDVSGVLSPEAMARRVALTFKLWRCDSVVVEVNQGGDMVEAILKAAAPHMPIKKVRASRGKYIRAEPVAALYEQGRVHHAGSFPELEDQMCVFTPDREGEKSPDRVDALVWALTALTPEVARNARADVNRGQGGFMHNAMPQFAAGLDYLDEVF